MNATTNHGHIEAKEIRPIVKAFVSKRTTLPLIIFASDGALYLALLGLVLIIDNFALKAILAVLLGLVIGMLFIVGHDCCHQSFTPNRKLNTLLGKIALAPSLHNFSLWDLGHNRTHHPFTNYAEKDYVYRPLTKEAYDAKSSWGRFQYRLYRSVIGHAFYYGIEIWGKKMLVPHQGIPNLDLKRSSKYWKDAAIILAYVLSVSFMITWVSTAFQSSILVNLFFAFLIPFAVWNWIMGFVIYQHHTNPHTNWYNSEEEWNYWEVQLEHSTHIRFPKPMNFLLHNIMEHTAHHSNMRIPLYQLDKAQSALENHFGDRIQIIKWTPRFYLESIRTCKLYDFKEHRWLQFA